MKTIDAKQCTAIALGRLGENEYTLIRFDVSAWLEELPGAVIGLYNQRPGDNVAYPVAEINVDGGIAIWTVTSTELTKTGEGRCELVAIAGEVVAKSMIFRTMVFDALDGSGEAPEPWEEWQQQLIILKNEAEQAADRAEEAVEHYPRIVDGVWEVWDVQEGAFVSTGVQAQGPQGVPGEQGETGEPGPQGETGPQGQPGQDGAPGTPGANGTTFTPSVSAEGVISWTNDGGKTNPQPMNIKGPQGDDGTSPTVSVADITGGHRVTITDANGTRSFDVMDGDDYVLTAADKAAIAQQAAEDVDVPVQDVQVNGTSVVTDGVANVPIGDYNTYGVIKVQQYGGLQFGSTNMLKTDPASEASIKTGTDGSRPIIPSRQHASTFYGLAKAAGSDMASSSNPVGTYTDAAKVAIQKMLGIYEAPWELIREDTVTNATEADIEITVDRNGQAFELTDVLIVLIVPTHSEDTTIGDHGRIYLYNNTTEIRRLYLLNSASKLVQANSVLQIAIGRLLNDNGLMSIDFYAWNANSGRTNLQIVPNPDLNGANTPFAINSNYINNIKIGKITGKLQYRLFGKRKWQ